MVFWIINMAIFFRIEKTSFKNIENYFRLNPLRTTMMLLSVKRETWHPNTLLSGMSLASTCPYHHPLSFMIPSFQKEITAKSRWNSSLPFSPRMEPCFWKRLRVKNIQWPLSNWIKKMDLYFTRLKSGNFLLIQPNLKLKVKFFNFFFFKYFRHKLFRIHFGFIHSFRYSWQRLCFCQSATSRSS